jgi:hypothetical protein
MQPARLNRTGLEKNPILRVTCLGLAMAAGFVTVLLVTGSPESQPETRTALGNQNPTPAPADAEDATTSPARPVPAQSDKETSKDAWLNDLEALEFKPFDEVASQILKALQSKDREVRLRAVNLLIMSKDNASILPLLAVAQRDADGEVRRNALVALENSQLKTNLTPYLLSGAADNDEDVRGSLVQTVWSLSPEQRDEFIGQAVYSSHPDVSSSAFEMLKHEYSKKTLDLLLNVYATNNVSQINNANDVMNSLLNQTFASASEASAWWQQHQADYRDDLSLNNDDLTPDP